MKTHSLQRITSLERAASALRSLLPGQESPWLLRSPSGDIVAYFDIVLEDGVDVVGPAVLADVSGRHYREDESVIAALRAIQQEAGGTIVTEQ